MAFKVQVGPPQISIHQGHTVLISEQDGQINWPSEKGLYFFDTRVVSSCRVDGGVAVPIPHRPGRADFPHPVLHERDSLAAA